MNPEAENIAKEIVGTTAEKIEFALLREFIMSNSLHITYTLSKEDVIKGYESFKELVESLPKQLQVVVFD